MFRTLGLVIALEFIALAAVGVMAFLVVGHIH
jgi:hypothetical protein